jgi:hypothetical protein
MDEFGGDRKDGNYLSDSPEKRRLILLQVPVVGEGKSLEGDTQAYK